jgi:hypothetical protein
MWKNRDKIFEGIKNNIFKKEHVEEIMRERIEICQSCPDIDYTGEFCAIPGTQPCCKNCGCCLSLKTRSLSSECPLLKWNAVLNEEEDDQLNAYLNQNDEDSI